MINNHLFKHKLFSVVWVLMFILTSCTPEYFIVKNFKESNNISVLVIPNQVILKTNSKIIDLYPEFNKLPKALQDTIWNLNTQFLEKKSDSLVINQFYSTFIQLMQSTEVKVYSLNEIDKFNAADTNAYVLKIVQMEMDENVKKIPYSQPVDYNSEVYKEIEIKTLSLNVWFEFSKAIKDTISPKVLFSSMTIGDVVDGKFVQNFEGKYDFKFKRDDLDSTQILPLAKDAAVKMSQYFYNHLINVYAQKVYQSYDYNLRYIGKQMNKQNGYQIYYPKEEEKFIEIKNKK